MSCVRRLVPVGTRVTDLTAHVPQAANRNIPTRMPATYRRGADGGRNGSRLATLAYAAAWLVAAAVFVGVLLTVLDTGEPAEVSLPPVQETELAQAAAHAGCELRRAKDGEAVNPPVAGGVGASPARPGFYDESQDRESLVAAMRDGVIVIQFRDLEESGVDLLRAFQEAVPDGTIVAPNDTGMPFAIAVTAYRRLLGCRELNQSSVDAIQLFRGRFVGSGPDV
jgi:hypothetical protein